MSDVYIEGLIPTMCFVKKEADLGFIPANVALRKNGVICEVKIYENKKVCRRAIRLLLVKCYDIKMVKLPGCSTIGVPTCS